jgi:hypothetical protein
VKLLDQARMCLVAVAALDCGSGLLHGAIDLLFVAFAHLVRSSR